jgi:hypothetical protein
VNSKILPFCAVVCVIFVGCVEVYETADDKEKSDGHRHGWFSYDTIIRGDKDHEIDNSKLGNAGFDGAYPKFPGSFTKQLDEKGPVYEPKYR